MHPFLTFLLSGLAGAVVAGLMLFILDRVFRR
jgi:hypothetical protein